MNYSEMLFNRDEKIIKIIEEITDLKKLKSLNVEEQ